MAGPIVFISHSRVLEGQLGPFREVHAEVIRELESSKPRTVAQLAYLSPDQSALGIVHVFPDAAAFNLHLDGVEERSKVALRYIEPQSYELYGAVSGDGEAMRDRLSASGRPVTTAPEYLGGFLRPGEG